MVNAPELKSVCTDEMLAEVITNRQYLDKDIAVHLNGTRKVRGTLRGYDVCKADGSKRNAG